MTLPQRLRVGDTLPRQAYTRQVTGEWVAYEHRATKDKPYTNADRFAIALTQIAGKRLTWKDLTGKEEGLF
jgi:hypothetical protein